LITVRRILERFADRCVRLRCASITTEPAFKQTLRDTTTNGNSISTRQKALALNLDATRYGTFAEIGGGQEVARWFFSVGGAAGTIAETISAYDMAMSDRRYGPTKRYVSRERLEAMLKHEFAQLLESLKEKKGDTKRFFAFANTVATRAFQKAGNGRGWLGIRFQTRPGEEASEVIIHTHLLDSTAGLEQEALGILGVNLVHAAFFYCEDPARFIASLMDELGRGRVEIDMIKFSGPAFPSVDNRLMSLQLVEQGLTDAAMFTAGGEVVQPSEVLYKKPILVERGSFRPATNLTLDLLERAREQFLEEPEVRGKMPVVFAEMTLRSLTPGPEAGHADFLNRADILRALGFDVLISRFEQHYQLADYFAAYTDGLIGIAAGLPTVRQQVADEKYYTELPGGVLESVGRLFKRSVKMYVYPTRDPVTGEIRTLANTKSPAPWHHLQKLLIELGRIVPIPSYNQSYLSIQAPDVLSRIQKGDVSWETMVPPVVAETIKAKRLFSNK
jgi:hypothetical protein